MITALIADTLDGRVTAVRIVANPDKLRALQPSLSAGDREG